MGQQTSNAQLKNHNNSKTVINQLKCKTSFQYLNPVRCQFDEHLNLDQSDQESMSQKTLRIDIKKHQAQYQLIENNQQEAILHSNKDLMKIEQIKVKWNQFIKMKKKNYLEDYTVLKQIGRGGFGCVHKVKARYTGLSRAAKRIKKSQLKNSQHQKLFEQMAIMISLDHPNIAKLYEVYDYKSYYVLILELCEGGELFKKIVTKQVNEKNSSKIMKQILWTLIYLHKKGIVHRDLKPQNMLFQFDSDVLKLIDFGIAVKIKPNQILSERLGTPYYIAPEVLCKCYNQKCDIWSAGVILFMMVSGCPPFRGNSESQVMESILIQSVGFKGIFLLFVGGEWHLVSQDCKNLILWMLDKNPDKRPSAEQAFAHPWIQKDSQRGIQLAQSKAINNIRGFSFQNKLQAVVYTYVVSQLLTSEQKKLLFQIFKQLDKNNDGMIQTNELNEALKSRKDISEERVKFLMRVIDTNGSGQIDYTEFLVAAIDPKQALTQEHFEQAFQYFDIDHSGVITFQEIVHFLEDSKQSEESIKKIFGQVDQNKDGNISKQEFVKLLMNQTKMKINSIKVNTDQKNSVKDPIHGSQESKQRLIILNQSQIENPQKKKEHGNKKKEKGHEKKGNSHGKKPSDSPIDQQPELKQKDQALIDELDPPIQRGILVTSPFQTSQNSLKVKNSQKFRKSSLAKSDQKKNKSLKKQKKVVLIK